MTNRSRTTRPRPLPTWIALAGWVLAASCAEPPSRREIDLLAVFAAAQRVPPAGLFELGHKVERPWQAPLATPIRPHQDWGQSADFGWRPLGASARLRLGPAPPDSEFLWLEILRVKPKAGAAPLEPLRVVPAWQGGDDAGVSDAGGSDAGVSDVEARATPAVELRPGRNRLRLPLPPAAQRQQLELRFEPPIAQPVRGLPELLVTGLAYLPAAYLPATNLPATNEKPELDRPALHADSDTGELQIRRSGRYAIGLELPAKTDPATVELRLRLRQGGKTPAAGVVQLTLTDLDGTQLPLPLDQSRLQRGELRTSFAPTAPRHLQLLLEVDLEASDPAGGPPASVPLVLQRPRFLLPALRPVDRPETRQREALPAARPNLLLIVLDAARGDRVGGDYPRPVAPQLEALAAEGLLFRQAYAECPSTLCSIPNLITGLPLLAAGAGGQAGQLADEHQTLAETLHGLGYRTLALSANPYNSVSRNLHQGFDRFEALWGRKSEYHGPDGMVRRAGELIAETPAEQPLFLQLHFLPPHEPYAPSAEFDRFTDPSYRGPIAPGSSLRAYRTGQAEFSAADLTQLIALYDGNFLRADAAAGRVFDALRQAGRWQNTAVVVTSDHGEAFQEHGQQGHNLDLFEEMLHVPLVIKPPDGVPRRSAWLDQPVGLGDILPTVYGLIGAEVPAAASGIDLLNEPASDRALVFRTSHGTAPTWALRIGHLKAIANPGWAQRWLFDLRQDPAEHDNLAATRPGPWSVMAGWLRARAETSTVASPAEPASFDEEELQTLRALGYAE